MPTAFSIKITRVVPEYPFTSTAKDAARGVNYRSVYRDGDARVTENTSTIQANKTQQLEYLYTRNKLLLFLK